MPAVTTDQGITRPIDADSADNPVAFINMLAGAEPRLVRKYLNAASRTALMTVLSENDISTLATEDRAEIYDGTTHVSLHTRSLYADLFRSTDSAPINNSTVLVSDASLVTALPTTGRFNFDLTLFYDSANAADLKVTFTFPAGATARWGCIAPSNAVSTLIGTAFWGTVTASGTTVVFGGSGTGSTNTVMALARGTVVMGGTSGNLQLQYAQQTADPTDTVVRAQSRLHVWRRA